MSALRRILAALTIMAAASPAFVPARQASAQSDADAQVKAAVRVPIDQLFAGMKARDTLMITSAFVPAGRLLDIRTRNGATTVDALEPAVFARSLLRAPAGDLVERIWDVKIDVDDNVANAWAQYDFHIGERFSHCGVDAFQLAKTVDGWKITQIMDTRRTEGCAR
jgi:hypothetical protein